MSTPPTSLGQVVDNLGCPLGDWPDDILPSNAVVLIAAIDDAGDPVLIARWSEGMSWLERVGMIAYANALELDNRGDDE